MAEEIKVVISKDGSLQYDVKGVKGRGCKALTKALDDLSGGQILETKTTGEFCEEEREHIKN